MIKVKNDMPIPNSAKGTQYLIKDILHMNSLVETIYLYMWE